MKVNIKQEKENSKISLIENLLEEENTLQKIIFPKYNQKIIKEENGTFTFENNETFKGKIIKGILQKGVYTWPNKQIYYGDLSPFNSFNKKGKIIFPNRSELIGYFNGEKNTIDKATYITSTRKYQGSFKNNKFNGKFIIRNIEGQPYYLYKGQYFNGLKQGKFELEKMYENKIFKITGNFERGKKDGEFKIYIVNKNDSKIKEKLIDIINFDVDFEKIEVKNEEKIENKSFFSTNITEKKINCMEIIKFKDDTYLLLGSYENLLIYYVNSIDDKINFDKEISLFKNADINDILKTKDNQILLCSSNNKFKLINLIFEEKNNISNMNTSMTSYNDFNLIQEFKGLENSKNIFCLLELSNGLIISGDCENVILWEKTNTFSVKNHYSVIERKKSNFFTDFFKSLFDNNDKDSNNDSNYISETSSISFSEYEIKYEIKDSLNLPSHIFCVLEIENNKNIITLAIAQPDSKNILFIKIGKDNKIIVNKEVEVLATIENRKKLMAHINDNLFVGCKNKLIVIDCKKYEIIYNISSETITYIDIYLDKFLIFGVTKEINSLYSYEGFLEQKQFRKKPNTKNYNIINISEFNKCKHKGNIINACLYKINDKNLIITVGTDNKIILLK